VNFDVLTNEVSITVCVSRWFD